MEKLGISCVELGKVAELGNLTKLGIYVHCFSRV